MRILVVEDERSLCDAIVRSLRRLAYSVDYCHDGRDAMDFLAVERFDLVVLDLNLPVSPRRACGEDPQPHTEALYAK